MVDGQPISVVGAKVSMGDGKIQVRLPQDNNDQNVSVMVLSADDRMPGVVNDRLCG